MIETILNISTNFDLGFEVKVCEVESEKVISSRFLRKQFG